MQEYSFDIIIAGAGAAGLVAAYELSKSSRKSIAIVEARDRTGGRIHTIDDKNFSIPVESGAEFIHGKMKLTLSLLKKAKVKHEKAMGEFWRKEGRHFTEQNDLVEDPKNLEKKFRGLKQDMSIEQFFKINFQHKDYHDLTVSLKDYVEGYYAADIRNASTLALCKEFTESSDLQYRVDGGYAQLANFLELECRKQGVEFFLSSPIKRIKWRKNFVEFSSGKNKFSSKKLIVTLPVGVLRTAISFSPALTHKKAALKKLGYGQVVKTVFQFDEKFWTDRSFTGNSDLSKAAFIFSNEKIPTWWTQYPRDLAMLTGWSGGPHAKEIHLLSDAAIKALALKSLANIFGMKYSMMKQRVIASYVFNWAKDPFSMGAYSYAVLDGVTAQRVLKKPIENTIYFAGEGLHEGPEIGTVEGAMLSGQEVANKI